MNIPTSWYERSDLCIVVLTSHACVARSHVALADFQIKITVPPDGINIYFNPSFLKALIDDKKLQAFLLGSTSIFRLTLYPSYRVASHSSYCLTLRITFCIVFPSSYCVAFHVLLCIAFQCVMCAVLCCFPPSYNVAFFVSYRIAFHNHIGLQYVC